MGRDIVDIPEVFRRAFEEDNWGAGGEGGDQEPGGGRGSGNGQGKPWWTYRWVWLGLLALLLLLSFNWIVTTYTEWLWFSALDYADVWLIQWLVRIGTFAFFFIVAAVILLVNWRIAYNLARRGSRSRLRLLSLPGMSGLVTIGALFLAFIFASAGETHWEQLLLYFNQVPYGTADPIFGRDISFYLFQLPVYRLLQGWLMPLLVMALFGILGLYLVDNWTIARSGQWRTQGWQNSGIQWQAQPTPALRRHAAVLATLIFLLWAVGNRLDIYELLYSTQGVTFGANYTDLKATMPALWVQLGLMVLLALATAVNIFRANLRLPLIAAALWLVAAVGLGNLYPGLLQRYAVEPNELARESEYIEHNIAFTRLAYGLDQVVVQPFGTVTELREQDLLENDATVQNVRLWDYRPLQQAYVQLQELRPYYQFSTIDIDRYDLGDEIRQVMLAVRELNKENLPARSWVNLKLEFTHGYGVVMNPVDRVTPEGRPDFFIKDLPPQSNIPLEVERPEIYYGEIMDDVVFVGSQLEEFDYPSGSANVYSSYEGQGGVRLGSYLNRLAFAIRFGEINLMLSEYIDADTRVMFHRQIRERVQQITPYLVLDADPYIVLADGRLVWMVDAYTLSRNFPYSTPSAAGFNYIRNAAKITIDAYDGRVTYYLTAPEDPIIQAYAAAFPGLFRPFEEMPESLQAHVRYPEDMFSVQARQYLKYHMTDVQVFYNQEDLWSIAQELFEENQQPIEPYYVIISLPREQRIEYLLIEPYTPANKNNMVAWMAGRSDPPNYGQLVAYEMPKQQLVFGPLQVEARISQDPQISAQISLWNQQGSRVIRGNLLVIPMNSSFLYVEPLYLQAETSQLPELKRVIVASGDRIAMRETLDEALAALVSAAPSVVELEGVPADGFPPLEATPAATSADETTPAAPTEATVQELIESANAHFLAAQAAQRAGDWATYGRELEALQRDLEQLLELTGEQ
jgi:uncharacterized protein